MATAGGTATTPGFPPPSLLPGSNASTFNTSSLPPPFFLTPEQFAALPHDNASGRLIAVIWPLIVFSALLLSLRVYCKFLRHKRLWWDDYILIASWVCITITTCCLTVGVVKFRLGVHIWDWVGTPEEAVEFFLLTNVAGTFSLVASIWSKTSFAFTLLRLTDGWMKWLVWCIVISMNIAMGLSALFNWVHCQPVRKSYDPLADGTCWPYETTVYYNVFSAAYSATMDIALALLPWKIIWKLQMKRKEKVGVAIAMSMGVIAGIMGFVKTSKVPAMLSLDMYDGIELFIWGNAESCVTIIAASIPILRVLIRDARTSAQRYQVSGSGHNNNDNNNLAGSGSSKRGDSARERKSGASGSSGSRSPDRVRRGSQSNMVIITAGRGGANNRRLGADDRSDRSILGEVGSPSRILRTNEIAVEYHPRRDTSSEEFEMQVGRRNKEIC